MDNIVAVSTPAGRGALAIIRMTGFSVLKQFLSITSNNTKKKVEPNRIYLTNIIEQNNRTNKNKSIEIIDEVMFCYYKSPTSYTGEDMIEISCHGNPVITNKIIDLLTQNKTARLALNGEFTERAFLNGKMDLTRAEAIASLIEAEDINISKKIMNTLTGGLEKKIHTIMDKIIEIRGQIEAGLDFPEEEINEYNKKNIKREIVKIRKNLEHLIKSSKWSEAATKGKTAVIAGIPNAGKSSLLNLLLKEDRAIVHKTAGTTRDYIKEKIVIKDLLLNIIDTAGLRKDPNEIESIGINKTSKLIETSEVIIHLMDITEGFTKTDKDFYNKYRKKIISVWNKIDIKKHIPVYPKKSIGISCKTIKNIELLKNKIYNFFMTEYNDTDYFYISARQKILFEETLSFIDVFIRSLEKGLFDEIIVENLKMALDRLNKITGRDYQFENLDYIFRRFCIGK